MYKRIIETINRGDLNITNNPVYPLLLIPEGKEERFRNNYMLFHFCMWLNTNSVCNFKALFDFALAENPIVDSHRSKPIWIMFGNKKDRTNFSQWLKKYRTRFIGNQIENTYVPRIPLDGRYTLSYVEISLFDFDYSFGESNISEDAFEKWSWIINNCEKKAWCGDKFTAFSSDKDAVLFKLRWG